MRDGTEFEKKSLKRMEIFSVLKRENFVGNTFMYFKKPHLYLNGHINPVSSLQAIFD